MSLKTPFLKSDDDDKVIGDVVLNMDSIEEEVKSSDYAIDEEFRVAEFTEGNVKNEYMDILQAISFGNSNLLLFMFKRSAFIVVTSLPVFLFLLAYYTFQILYRNQLLCSTEPELGAAANITIQEKTEPTAVACTNKVWHDWVGVMKTNESTATKYLTFILGFYVGQMIKRWWDQVKSLPQIELVTNCLAGFIQLEFKEEHSNGQKVEDATARVAARDLKKKIVRYCLLSWTMCLSSFSKPLQKKFNESDAYIKKGLLNKNELNALQGDKSVWKDQWWIPISWAICLVNATNKDKSQGCKVKEQKEMISTLNKFHTKLHDLYLFQTNPLPLIYGQAINVAIVSWVGLGIFGSQYLGTHHGSLFFLIFRTIPLFQLVKIIIIYTWLRVANIVRNPFGMDNFYDINLVDTLDHNIWKASLSIKQQDNPPI